MCVRQAETPEMSSHWCVRRPLNCLCKSLIAPVCFKSLFRSVASAFSPQPPAPSAQRRPEDRLNSFARDQLNGRNLPRNSNSVGDSVHGELLCDSWEDFLRSRVWIPTGVLAVVMSTACTGVCVCVIVTLVGWLGNYRPRCGGKGQYEGEKIK